MKKKLLFVFFMLLLVIIVSAHEGGEESDEAPDEFNGEISAGLNPIESSYGYFEDFLPLPFVIVIFVASFIPVLLLIIYKKDFNKKHIVFWMIIYIVGSATLVIIADTINLTLSSETKGPVHWHADFQIWNCGEKLDLIEPEGMLNRIGTELFHEHNDGRMHAEGIIKNIRDVDLHNFFDFIGGKLIETSFDVLTDDGVVKVKDGDLCNGESGEVQIFLYKVINSHSSQKEGFIVEQLKVNENYVLSPYQDVPPGDCIIIEFDKRKDKTDRICDTYKLAVEQKRMVIA